jgi:hypothetical protein
MVGRLCLIMVVAYAGGEEERRKAMAPLLASATRAK